MKQFVSSILFMAGVVLLAPSSVFAQDSISIVSGGDTLMVQDTPNDTPENVHVVVAGSQDPIGTQYPELVLKMPDGFEPAVVVVMGKLNAPWEYDAAAGTVTVDVTSADFGENGPFGGEDAPQDMSSMIAIGMVEAVEGKNQDGPPVEATGMYMSTNVFQWNMIPPSPGNLRFGFELTASEGHEGFFDFFVPQGIIDYLGTAKEDLVLFQNDEQATITFDDLGDVGVLFSINVVFTGDNAESSTTRIGTAETTADDGTLTKTFATGEALPVSITANKEEASKGDKVRVYGWVKNNKKSERVVLMRKEGDGKFTKVKTLRTKKDGLYTVIVRMGKKDTSFKAQWVMKDGSKEVSEVKEITLE